MSEHQWTGVVSLQEVIKTKITIRNGCIVKPGTVKDVPLTDQTPSRLLIDGEVVLFDGVPMLEMTINI